MEDFSTNATSGRLASLRTSVMDLHRATATEFEKVRDQWALVQQAKEELESFKDSLNPPRGISGGRLKVNVGGSHFEIGLEHILGTSFFGPLSSGIIVPPDEDGFIFIDRDPTYFLVILRHLRGEQIILSEFTESELLAIREEAEFYLLLELTKIIDTRLRGSAMDKIISINLPSGEASTFCGVFFEVICKQSDLILSGVAFTAGENAKMVVEIHHSVGSITNISDFKKISCVELVVKMGEVIWVPLRPTRLSPGVNILGLYSPTCSSAVAVVPRRTKSIEESHHIVDFGSSYHIPNFESFLHPSRKDIFEFSGSLAVRNSTSGGLV